MALDPSIDTIGACNKADMPRSRDDGFDYDGPTNTVQFFGDCHPSFAVANIGSHFAVSYKYWIEDSPDPDGNDDPCADCEAPFICVVDQCLCPADCGGGLAANETCDTQTCSATCLEDCGGCDAGFQCDVDACACVCDDCAGPNPGPGFTCNLATCEYECGGCAGPTPGFASCNLDTCAFECGGCGAGEVPSGQFCNTNPLVCDFDCLPDCGGCGDQAVCNQDTCTCDCPDNCGGNPPQEGMTCNQALCRFECLEPPADLPSPGPNFVWDTVLCAYVCPADCGGGDAGPNAICDAATCELRCPADCGGCDGRATCDTERCACECPADCGGPAPSVNHSCDQASCTFTCNETPTTPSPGPNFVWDVASCSYVCPDDCGEADGVARPEFCNTTTCEVQCLPACGGCAVGDECNEEACACECVEDATCAACFVWSAETCSCGCDTTVDCGPTRVINPDTCACECGDNCNDACTGATPICQQSLCTCRGLGG